MAEKGYYLSEQLYQKLLRIVSWFDNQGVGQLRGNADPLAIDHEEHPAPEMYVAKVGIFGLHQMGDDPAVAECTVYRIVPDLSSSTGYSLEAVDGLTRQVFNMTGRTLCPGSFIEVRRDKFGSWITETAPRKFLAVIVSRTDAVCDSTTGTGTGDDLTYPSYQVASVHRVAYGGARGCESYTRDLPPYRIYTIARERNDNVVAPNTIIDCEFEFYTDERYDPITGTGTGETGPASCRVSFSSPPVLESSDIPCITPYIITEERLFCDGTYFYKNIYYRAYAQDVDGCWKLGPAIILWRLTTTWRCDCCDPPPTGTGSGPADPCDDTGEDSYCLIFSVPTGHPNGGCGAFNGLQVQLNRRSNPDLLEWFGTGEVGFFDQYGLEHRVGVTAWLYRGCGCDSSQYCWTLYAYQFTWRIYPFQVLCGWPVIHGPPDGYAFYSLGSGDDPSTPPITTGGMVYGGYPDTDATCFDCVYPVSGNLEPYPGTWELTVGVCPADTTGTGTGTGTGDCPANIQAVCCADPVPCDLFIEFSGGTGALACLAGMSIPIEWTGSLAWVSTTSGGGGNTTVMSIGCNAVTGQWYFEMVNTGLGGFWPACDFSACGFLSVNLSGTCSPFRMFGLLSDPTCGAINVNVVE